MQESKKREIFVDCLAAGRPFRTVIHATQTGYDLVVNEVRMMIDGKKGVPLNFSAPLRARAKSITDLTRLKMHVALRACERVEEILAEVEKVKVDEAETGGVRGSDLRKKDEVVPQA